MFTAHLNLQDCKNADKRFLLANVGDNVSIRIPDIERDCCDLTSVLGVEGSLCNMRIEHSALKQLYSRSEFFMKDC